MIKTINHHVEPNGHCATICQHGGGILVAYYNGPECTDHQSVHVEYWENDKLTGHYQFQEKTGNCVLIPSKDHATLIYSLFEDYGPNGERPITAVDRWKYCSNWKTKVRYSNNQIHHTQPGRLNHTTNWLVRCNPIKIKDYWLLPMYDEAWRYGIILKSNNGWSWQPIGTIGAEDLNIELIQPTLWHDGEHLHSLSRDMTEVRMAWYSRSEDVGETWSKPIHTPITNDNNSLIVINDNTRSPLIIWNHGPKRRKLVLGRLDQSSLTAKPYLELNTTPHASYPNYCFDANNNLQIVHTEFGVIKRHIIDQNTLLEIEQKAKDTEKTILLSDLIKND